MKLWHSFKKELKLSSKSYYFYIEIFMALLLLLLLLFVIPENFDNRTEEYIYLDLPEALEERFIGEIEKSSPDGGEVAELKVDGEVIEATYYETEGEEIYLVDSEETISKLAEDDGKFGAVVYLGDENEIKYRYYMQGYESERLKNLYGIIHNDGISIEELQAGVEAKEVRSLGGNYEELSDRDGILPVFLTFNGSLMGLFIIASYIFLDRQEGIIQAYAVTPAPVWTYLMSKVGVVTVTSIVSSLIILLPVVGLELNYGMLILFLVCSGFFATSLGLIITSYYRDIVQSFGALYIVVIAMVIPNISYFVPSWQPFWIKAIPTYYMLESFKEMLLKSGDMMYVAYTSVGFLGAGILLFTFANYRFKKTLLM